MKVNNIIRQVLLLATLSFFSSRPAEAKYAIDTDSCNTAKASFIKAQLIRASTIGKFVSLNLNPGVPVTGIENPYKWSLDAYIVEQIKLLMGDTQEALSQAQWVFGGTGGMSHTGIVGVTPWSIAKQAATDDDVVFYCNPIRLSESSVEGDVIDPDASLTYRGKAIKIPQKVKASCPDVWAPDAKAYIFWQFTGDAARITWCGWFINLAMSSANTAPNPDTRRIGNLISLVSQITREPLWTLPPPELETPSIEDFALFDAAMISALANRRQAGFRLPTPQPEQLVGNTITQSQLPITWASVVSAALNYDTRYTSGAFVYLALVIYAYRSGVTINANTGRFGAYVQSESPYGFDFGDGTQDWAADWQPPYGIDD